MRTRIVTVLVLVITLCGFISTNGYSGDDKYSRESIRGIEGVYVLVEKLDPKVVSDGLTEDAIHNDVELKLRQNGIKVLSKEEHYKVPGSPVLYIVANFIKLEQIDLYAYSIRTTFEQSVTLDRTRNSLTAATWSMSFIAVIPINKLNGVREQIRDFLDRFINAYLSVNPKK
jgi:hypothetical protein